MLEEYGDGASIETGVDIVEDGTGHGDGEVELVHGGDVGGYDGHHVSTLDAERCDRGGYLEASTVGL